MKWSLVVCFARDVIFSIIIIVLCVVMSSKFVKVMNLYYTHTNRCTLIQIQIMSNIIIDSISFFALLALAKNVYGFFLHIWAKKSQYFIWSSANALDIDAMRSIFKYWRQQQFNSNYCKLANFVSQLDCSVTQKCEKHAKQKQNSWLCVCVCRYVYIFTKRRWEQELKTKFKSLVQGWTYRATAK